MSNVITTLHGGCVIHELWTGPRVTGESLNIYDRTRAKWHQTWVDSTGDLHEYWGALRADGVMAFTGEQPSPKPGGSRAPTRMSFTPRPDGTVRQFAEVSEDGGKTWTVTVDLIYTKRTK